MASNETIEFTDARDYWANCSYGWHNLADGAKMAGRLDVAVYFEELATSADLMLYVLGA